MIQGDCTRRSEPPLRQIRLARCFWPEPKETHPDISKQSGNSYCMLLHGEATECQKLARKQRERFGRIHRLPSRRYQAAHTYRCTGRVDLSYAARRARLADRRAPPDRHGHLDATWGAGKTTTIRLWRTAW